MTKNKEIKLHILERLLNWSVSWLDTVHSLTLRPYQWLRDCYDHKRNQWRWPRGIVRIELTLYSMAQPHIILKNHGVYTFTKVYYTRLVPKIEIGKTGLERRPVVCFYFRKRQETRALHLLRKYSQSNGTLNWLPYEGQK